MKGPHVTLFPDLNGFDKWKSKVEELSHIAIFSISDLLERKATAAEKKQGFDIADYLIKFRYNEFLQIETEASDPFPVVQPMLEVKPLEQPQSFCTFIKPGEPKLESCEQWIIQMENYFSEAVMPCHPVRLSEGTTILDCSLFIASHFAAVKTYNGQKSSLPYLNV